MNLFGIAMFIYSDFLLGNLVVSIIEVLCYPKSFYLCGNESSGYSYFLCCLSERAFGDQSQLVIIEEVEGLVLSYFKQLLFCSVFNIKPMWVF